MSSDCTALLLAVDADSMNDNQLSAATVGHVTCPMLVISSWLCDKHLYASLLNDMPAPLAACIQSLFQRTAMCHQTHVWGGPLH